MAKKSGWIREFYREKLRPVWFIRIIKNAVWTLLWALRWKIAYPVERAFSQLGLFVRWKIAYPAAQSIQSFVWFARWRMGYPAAQFFRSFIWVSRWRVFRPLVRAIVPRPILNRLHRLRGGGAKGLFWHWMSPPLSLVSLTTAVSGLGRTGHSRPVGFDDLFNYQPGTPSVTAEVIASLCMAEHVHAVPSMVFPRVSQSAVHSLEQDYEFPEIVVTQISEAEVIGRSNLTVWNNMMLHHDLYRFSHDFTSEELHGKIRVFPKKSMVARIAKPELQTQIAEAAVFTDSCSSNYAHWLTEVLPRINLFCRANPGSDVPLIVDAGLHRNIEASLLAVAGETKSIVRLGAGNSAQVKRLLVTSPTGYIPFERRSGSMSGHFHGVFSSYALSSLRRHLRDVLPESPDNPLKKIFLRRNSHSRLMRNERQLEERLIERGFSVVQPELLSFADQFHLFSNAEAVVGATGAALANLVFCPEDVRVVICLSSHPDHSYGYWQSMAAASGSCVSYVLGPIEGAKATGVHADFSVDIDDVIRAIDH